MESGDTSVDGNITLMTEASTSSKDTGRSNSNTGSISPLQKDKLFARARKLSGNVVAITELNATPERIQKKGKNRELPKNSTVTPKCKTNITPSKNKTPGRKSKKASALEDNKDIRSFINIANDTRGKGDSENINSEFLNVSVSSVSDSFYSTCEKVIHDTEITFKTTELDSTLLTTSQPMHDDSMATNDNHGNQHDTASTEVTNAMLLQSLTSFRSDMERMFKDHKEEMVKAVADIKSRLTAAEAKTDKVDSIEFSCNKADDRLKKLEEHVNDMIEDNRIAMGTIVRQSAIIHELQSKVDHLEQQRVKCNMLFFGIADSKQENSLSAFLTFVRDLLRPDQLIYPQDAYRLGAYKDGKIRPLMVVFRDANEKNKIRSNWKNLKGVKNSQGKYYRYKDQTSAASDENDKRINEVKYWNRKKTVAARLEMTVKKGTLTIGEEEDKEVYRKKVTTPTADTLLNMEAEEKKRIHKVKLGEGSTICKGSCKFIGYTKAVKTFEEIQDCYSKVRLLHPQARHVVCAFRIPGKEEHFLQDYVDDDEFGAGRKILDILREAEIFYRVVLVVRYYGGQKLGKDRFTAYKEATESAINHFPHNSILNLAQTPYPVQTPRERTTTINSDVQDNTGTQPVTPGSAISEEDWNRHCAQFIPQTANKLPGFPSIRHMAPTTVQSN